MAQSTKKKTTKKTTKRAANNGNRRNGAKPKAVYFLSLTVENVRCFGEKQTLDLSDRNGRPRQWTIILGDNGAGKTTLLQSFISLLPTRHKAPTSDFTARYSVDVPMKSYWIILRNNSEQYYLSADFFVGKDLFDLNGFRTVGGLAHQGHNRIIAAFVNDLDELNEIACFAYGASRRMGETPLSENNDMEFYKGFFSDSVPLQNAEEWLLQADYAASKDSPIQFQAKKRLEKIEKLLIQVLPNIDEIRFTQPTEEKFTPQLQFKTPYGWVSIKDLSLGYRTLIAWMVDFAARMFERYPDSENPLAEPAVVLVDEIDLHLHPKWQRDLIDYLTNLFPNTQFIVTTHSPLIVQAAAARDANIVVCRREGDHVVIDNSPEAVRGWRADQILASDLFENLPPRDKEIEELTQKRNRILAKSKLTKRDREYLAKLEKEIGPLPVGETPEEIEAMDIIRRAAEELKQKG